MGIRSLDDSVCVSARSTAGLDYPLPKVGDRMALEEEEEEVEGAKDGLDDEEHIDYVDLVAIDGDAEEEDADGEFD
ncbi:hypothetical protein V491_08252 [Pseudogymnoascus sp. VKM F-3775]|nr:hypothetical protein V491_08252 [Pseudogymnoascus sp. VKM F-3775]